MDWDDLRIVLALVRAKTLAEAASALGVAHTTVSRRIRACEAALGVRLFDRTPEGPVPTAAGEELAQAAAQVEETVLDARARVTGRDRALRGRVRVATLDLLANRYAALFTDFTQHYPEVDLEITTGTHVVSLARHEADVALRTSNQPDEQLVGRKLGEQAYAVYGARHLVEAVGAAAPLSAYPWITWDSRFPARITREWLARWVPDARIAAYVDSPALFLELVRQGIGIAHVMVADAESDDRLVRLRDREPGWSMDLWLLTHPDLRASARIRAFIEHVAGAITQTRDRMAGTDLPWAPEVVDPRGP